MAWKLSNFMTSTLRQSIAAADTTIYVDADEVDLLPTLGVGDKAKLVIFNADYREIVNITAWNTNGTLTVERAQESTTARDWASGTKVVHTPTAEIIQIVINSVGAVVYTGTATNVSNAYTVNVGASNPLPTFTEGEEVSFEINATNTGAVTLDVTDGTTTIAAKSVLHQDGQALEAGDFVDNWFAIVRWNETRDAWILVSDTSHNLHAEQINDGPVPGINRHRNGKFDFWNNGATFNTPASASETADGWEVQYDGTIDTFSVSRQDFTLGQTDVPNDPKHYLRWAHTAAGSGSTLRRLRVRIPGVHWRNGELVSRKVWLKADSARTVVGKIIQHFGTGGAPSADVEVTSENWSVTTSWTAFDLQATMTSIAGKTLGSGGDDAVWLTLDLPLNVTMTIEVANDQLVPGHLVGYYSDTFPVPWWLGGTGGSFANLADFISVGLLLTQAIFDTNNPDLAAIEAQAGTSGFQAKTAANTWALRTFTDTTGITWTNPAGVAGNPSFALSTGLLNYHADPMSAAELASITAVFGTAAFVADNTLVHLAGAETISGDKKFTGTVEIEGTAPRLLFDETDQAADEKLWDAIITGGDLIIRTRTDADGAGVSAITFNRGTGTALTDITITAPLLAPVGAVGTPSHSFVGDPTTGFYRTAASRIGVASGGTLVWTFRETTHLSTLPILVPNGAVGAVSYGFSNDADLGLYRIGSDNMGVAVNGVLVLDFSTTRILAGVGMDMRLPDTRVAPTGINSIGYRGSPVVDGNAAYAFPAADAGCTVYHDEAGARTYTIPANASVPHPIGTMFIISNTGNAGAAGAITLAITSDTLRRADGTAGTGSRTIAASAKVVIEKVASTVWEISGVFT